MTSSTHMVPSILSRLAQHISEAVSLSDSCNGDDEHVWQHPHRGDSTDCIVQLFEKGSEGLFNVFSSGTNQSTSNHLLTPYIPDTHEQRDKRSESTPNESSSDHNRVCMGVHRIKELSSVLSVLHRSPSKFRLLFSYESFWECLVSHKIVEELVEGLAVSHSAWKSQRCPHMEIERELILLYAETLFFLMEHQAALQSFEEEEEMQLYGEAWSNEPERPRKDQLLLSMDSKVLFRLYDCLCDIAQGTESFQQRAALLLTASFCLMERRSNAHSPPGGVNRSFEGPRVLRPLQEKMIQHFQSTPNSSLVSHFVVLALLQHVPMAPGAAVDEEMVQMWLQTFPVLSQGSMYDPDFSCMIEHDGTRSETFQLVKQAMGRTIDRVWCHIHSAAWWSSFSFKSLHSICRSAYIFAYTWVSASLTSGGVWWLKEHILDQIKEMSWSVLTPKEMEGTATSAVTGSLVSPSASSKMLSYLTLYAYLWSAAVQTDFSLFDTFSQLRLDSPPNSVASNESNVVSVFTPNQLAVLSCLFPMPVQVVVVVDGDGTNSHQALNLLPQFILHLKMILHSPHCSHIAASAAYDQTSALYFDACCTLFCLLLSTVQEREDLQQLEHTAGTNIETLLLHLFNVYIRLEHPNVALMGQLFTCIDRYYTLLSQPALVSNTLLNPAFIGALGQHPSSISVAVLQGHLYGSLAMKSNGSPNVLSLKAAGQHFLTVLGHLSSGLVSHYDTSMTFFLTLLRYVHRDLEEGRLILHVHGREILLASPNIFAVLMEGAVVLFRRVVFGVLFGVEGALLGALNLILRIVAGLASAGCAYEILANVSIPIGDDLHPTGTTPGIALFLQILFSKNVHVSTPLQRTAAELWCLCLQSSQPNTFHTIRLSLRSSSRSNLSEKVIECLRADIGKRENIFRLQVLFETQHYDCRLFMHLISQQIAGLSKENQDMVDLRLVKVLCEIVSSKDAKPQGKGLALQLIMGLGLHDAIQTSAAVKLLSQFPSYEGAYLAAVASDYILKAILAKRSAVEAQSQPTRKEGGGGVPTPLGGLSSVPSTPRNSASLLSRNRTSLSSFALPRAGGGGNSDLLYNLLENGTKYLTDLMMIMEEGIPRLRTVDAVGKGGCSAQGIFNDSHGAVQGNPYCSSFPVDSLKDSFSSWHHALNSSLCRSSFCMRDSSPFEHALLLGPSFCFHGSTEANEEDEVSSLNSFASDLYSVTRLCHTLEKVVWILAPEELEAMTGCGKLRDILEISLRILSLLSVVVVPQLVTVQRRCVVSCLKLVKGLSNLEEVSPVAPPSMSVSLAAPLQSLVFSFLEKNKRSISLVSDILVILRAFPLSQVDHSHLLEYICSQVAELIFLFYKKTKNPRALRDDAQTLTEWDCFFEEAHRFFIRHGFGASSVALQSIASSIVNTIDFFSSYIVVAGAPDAWVTRLTCRLHFLQTLLIRHPHTQGYISKPVIQSLAIGLGQILHMPYSTSQGWTPGQVAYVECAAHEVWCAVLELLLTLVTCGSTYGMFAAVKTGWVDAVIPISFAPRFQWVLSGFSLPPEHEAHESAPPIFSWDLQECHLCIRLASLLAASGAYVEPLIPLVIAGFQTMHSSRFLQTCHLSLPGSPETEGADLERMKLYICQIVRDQLSFLFLQPSFLLPVNSFASEAHLRSGESRSPRLSFVALCVFIYRQLRSIQRSSSVLHAANYACISVASMAPRNDPLERSQNTGGSRSPSLDSVHSFLPDLDDSTSLCSTSMSGEKNDLTMETLPFIVESVELAIGIFVRGAMELLQQIKKVGHLNLEDKQLEKDLRSSGERLIYSLDNIEKSLEESEVALIPFVKRRRRQLQMILLSLQQI